jgi:hypothetical protein
MLRSTRPPRHSQVCSSTMDTILIGRPSVVASNWSRCRKSDRNEELGPAQQRSKKIRPVPPTGRIRRSGRSAFGPPSYSKRPEFTYRAGGAIHNNLSRFVSLVRVVGDAGLPIQASLTFSAAFDTAEHFERVTAIGAAKPAVFRQTLLGGFGEVARGEATCLPTGRGCGICPIAAPTLTRACLR